MDANNTFYGGKYNTKNQSIYYFEKLCNSQHEKVLKMEYSF